MGGNPVETKVEAPKPADVLAAAAGVPAPPKTGGLWAKFRYYRKLALILGGSGALLGGGGYGYKYLTPKPGTANAQPDTTAVASAPTADSAKPEPTRPLDDDPLMKIPPVLPAKAEVPAIPDVPPPIKSPLDGDKRTKATAFGSDQSDTSAGPAVVAPILPPVPDDDGPKDDGKKRTKDNEGSGLPPIEIPAAPFPTDDGKKPSKDNDGPGLLTIPAPPNAVKSANDKKKPAHDAGDTFKATDPIEAGDKPAVKIGPRPMALPTDVTDKKEKPAGTDGPVIRIGGADPMPPVPPIPDVPTIAPPPKPMGEGASPKKDEAPGIPKIVDIDLPPPPVSGKPGDPGVKPPAPVKDDLPAISPPDDKPKVKPAEVPTIKVDVKLPDGPPTPPAPPVGADPLPPIGPAPAAPPPAKKTEVEEDWHTWKDGVDTYTLISQEYYHDGKYAKALEAYAKEHRKSGDKFIRVPELWRLQELYPHLIGADDKPKADVPDRGAPPTPPSGGIKFEPATPASSTGRGGPPPAAVTASARNEYKVTAEESIRDVARKALGDANSWRKLMDLNPGLDPTLPVPAGTVLQLPK
jgi:hypothetical protein